MAYQDTEQKKEASSRIIMLTAHLLLLLAAAAAALPRAAMGARAEREIRIVGDDGDSRYMLHLRRRLGFSAPAVRLETIYSVGDGASRRPCLAADGRRNCAPPAIASVRVLPSPADALTDWEVDVAAREAAHDAERMIRATLAALGRFESTTPHLRIPGRAHARAVVASRLLAACARQVGPSHRRRTLTLLNVALDEAEAAFLDPVLLPQLHFPGEHIYAVYLPLWMPLVLPLLFGIADEMANLRFGDRFWRAGVYTSCS